MIQKSVLLETLSVDELDQLIGKSVKNGITEIQQEFHSKHQSEELLTRQEACEFLKVDSSTLWAWTNKKKIKAYGLGARRYYKRSELLESLIVLKK
jgi:excisionase family DNA binding protein